MREKVSGWAKVLVRLRLSAYFRIGDDRAGQHPDGYQYSQFAELYRRFEKRLSVVLRQPHRAGEKCFVDFCDGLPLLDEHTGERISTELFVGALGLCRRENSRHSRS